MVTLTPRASRPPTVPDANPAGTLTGLVQAGRRSQTTMPLPLDPSGVFRHLDAPAQKPQKLRLMVPRPELGAIVPARLLQFVFEVSATWSAVEQIQDKDVDEARSARSKTELRRSIFLTSFEFQQPARQSYFAEHGATPLSTTTSHALTARSTY